MEYPDEETDLHAAADEEEDGAAPGAGEEDRFAIFRDLAFETDFVLPEDGLRVLEERLHAREQGREEN